MCLKVLLHSPFLCGWHTVEVTGMVFPRVTSAIMSPNISGQLREPCSSSPVGTSCRNEHGGQAASGLAVGHKQRTAGADDILTEGQSLSQVSQMGSEGPLWASDCVSSPQCITFSASSRGSSCGRFGAGFIL